MSEKNLVEIHDLVVDVITPSGIIRPVRNVSFSVKKNEIMGIIGESGSGKSMTIKSIMRLHNERKVDVKGSIVFEEEEILEMSEKRLNAMRGKDISMIFQDPMVSLNPIQKCGKQLVEMIVKKEKISKKEAKEKVLEVFRSVEITPPEQRFHQYPFELSGGMLQRIVIAMAIVCNSKLLLADEPTTALDVTTQGQILNLIKEMQQKNHMSVIVVTHNFGVVAELCDSVSVMYAGEIIESGDVRTIFNEPCHPYTIALMESRPDPSKRGEKMTTIPGVPPSLHAIGKGCPFAARCKRAMERCFVEKPPEICRNKNHRVTCHLCQ